MVSIVPEQTQVTVHVWSIHRDPRNFSVPDAFLPERWLHNPTTHNPNVKVHNAAALIPFSHGPMQCAGKQLAMMEMRMVLTWLIQNFEFEPAEGREWKSWDNRTEDWFVMSRPPLPAKVVLKK